MNKMPPARPAPTPQPVDDSTPRDRPIIAWCTEIENWTVVEYIPQDRRWRETFDYESVTPTHWLPIELPEAP